MKFSTRWAFVRGALREEGIARLGGTKRLARYVGTESPLAADAQILEDLGDPGAPREPTTSSHAHKSTQAKRVFRLEATTIDLINGYVYDGRDRLVADAVSWSPAHAFVRSPAKPSRPDSIDADVLTLGSEAYYHWLIEDVPAYLQARRHAPDAPTVVRATAPGYVRDLLRLLGSSSIDVDRAARVRSLVVAAKGAALHPNSIDLATLREFRDGLALPEPDLRRFYVSRRDAGRIPDNEDEVERVVLAAGYEIVTLTGLRLEQQIARFAGAEGIVATHGAGLANLAWCHPTKTRVTEIATRPQPDCFAQLAAIVGLEYSRIDAESAGRWIVDLEALALAIR